VEIVRATEADRDAVLSLCSRVTPGDYVPSAWSTWMATPGAVMLLARSAGALLGCVYSAPVAEGQVFSQALRVAPEARRSGAASLLMREQTRLLASRGVRIQWGVTGCANAAARAFFPTVGWRERGIVKRRRLAGWTGRPGRGLAAAAPAGPMRVSRPGVALFRRIVFDASHEWLAQAAAAGRWRWQGGAHALLDPPSDDLGTWVVAQGGPASAVGELLATMAPAPGAPPGLAVEAPDDPALHAVLDGIGFAPAREGECYVVLAATQGGDG
jgi:GNAT superfamily N-acetyltransferase